MTLVVVAEDDTDLRALTVLFIEKAGHTVVETTNGAHGLTAVREHSPDVVISDIDMPSMSGIELCQAIRADPTTHDLPVILVSGSLEPNDPRPAHAGASAYVHKPFTRSILVGCLEKVLRDGHQDGQPPAVFE